MSVVGMTNLLEAGVHFGHRTNRWNPKMGKYIYTSRKSIYIIDLQKTQKLIEFAYRKVNEVAENGGKVLFVGTKKQAQDPIQVVAERTGMYYVNTRWLGGTLTNYATIKKRIDRMDEIEKMEADGTFDLLPKKEVMQIRKEFAKLERFLGGIRTMKGLPELMIIVNPRKEINAIKEARRLGIPVVGIVDTNCDPDDVDYIIPANDDAVRSVELILNVMGNAICEATGCPMVTFPEKKRENHTSSNKKENNTTREARPSSDSK